MRWLLALLLFSPLAHAQIVYTDGQPLDGATVKGAIHVQLQQTTGGPCTFTPDWAKSNLESGAPYVLANESGSVDDTNLWNTATATDGKHVLSVTCATGSLTATFTIDNVPDVPNPPGPPVWTASRTLTWTPPAYCDNGKACTPTSYAVDCVPEPKLTVTGPPVQLTLPAGSYSCTVRALLGAASSDASQGVTFTITPPPADPCVADPLTLTVKAWPAANTGSRSLSYATNKPVTGLALAWPLKATVTDARGCTATVKR